jgi:hypothetical protein
MQYGEASYRWRGPPFVVLSDTRKKGPADPYRRHLVRSAR